MHSVEKTAWEERYRVDGKMLSLVGARIQGSGAGMDPPPDAQFRNGWWTWRPTIGPLPAIRLTLSSFTRDYDLCWRGRCQSLHRLVSTDEPEGRAQARRIDEGTVVEIRSCDNENRE